MLPARGEGINVSGRSRLVGEPAVGIWSEPDLIAGRTGTIRMTGKLDPGCPARLRCKKATSGEDGRLLRNTLAGRHLGRKSTDFSQAVLRKRDN
jgi:hypothetical protein